MSTKLFESERAISNLIATLILIAVAVVGGAFAYTAFRNQATSTTTSASLQVQSLDAVEAGGTVQLSTTVKNVGTQRLSNITVNIEPGNDNNKMTEISNLDPGQTGSDSMENNASLTPGTEYAVRITADTPATTDALTKTMTVRVES